MEPEAAWVHWDSQLTQWSMDLMANRTMEPAVWTPGLPVDQYDQYAATEIFGSFFQTSNPTSPSSGGQMIQLGPVQHSNEKNDFQLHDGAMSLFYAGHILNSKSFYGVEVTSDMYGFTMDQDEATGVVIQLNNLGDNPPSSLNGISVGWHVYPSLYGDSKTHFFVYWTRDGYQYTGCYNLKCPGFIPEANIPIVPGATIDSVSNPGGIKRTIIFKVFKDSGGDWLLHIGFDSEPYLIGRFPKSLFNNILGEANEIKLVGLVQTRTTRVAPMGSGFLSNNKKKAASLSNIQIIDQNGQASNVTQNSRDFMTDKAIYSVSQISSEGMFTYEDAGASVVL
ncbi:hypothetical protein EJB05_18532, partial [Eragrostis curvula]